MSITASGKLFQKYAEEILEARKAVLTAIAETERVPRGEIIVGANEGTCLHILPEVFAEFKKNYPDVSVGIKRADYAKTLDSVIDNSVDFGVVSLPVTDARLTVVPIHRDGWPFVAGFAEVEVDLETGKYHIVDYLAVADVGTVIHPRALGGVLQRAALGIEQQCRQDPRRRLFRPCASANRYRFENS